MKENNDNMDIEIAIDIEIEMVVWYINLNNKLSSLSSAYLLFCTCESCISTHCYEQHAAWSTKFHHDNGQVMRFSSVSHDQWEVTLFTLRLGDCHT